MEYSGLQKLYHLLDLPIHIDHFFFHLADLFFIPTGEHHGTLQRVTLAALVGVGSSGILPRHHGPEPKPTVPKKCPSPTLCPCALLIQTASQRDVPKYGQASKSSGSKLSQCFNRNQ